MNRGGIHTGLSARPLSTHSTTNRFAAPRSLLSVPCSCFLLQRSQPRPRLLRLRTVRVLLHQLRISLLRCSSIVQVILIDLRLHQQRAYPQ